MIVVDTHAHLYPCYSLDRFLAAAERNLARVGAAVAPGGEPCARMLCLTERATETAFGDLRAGRVRPARYRIAPCGEDAAFRAVSEDGSGLFVVVGRQIVTRETLEVLALGVTPVLSDGLAVQEVIARIRDAGGVPVLPWSPGKWIGRRGRLVRALLETPGQGQLVLGDTALRPHPAWQPRAFSLARARGVPLVAGSDPLPLPGEERHVGRYATAFAAAISTDRPAASLRAALSLEPLAVRPCGQRRAWTSVAVALARHALARR